MVGSGQTHVGRLFDPLNVCAPTLSFRRFADTDVVVMTRRSVSGGRAMVVINLKKKDGKKKHKRGATEVEQGAQQQAQAVTGMATFVVDRRTEVRNTSLAATRADGSYHDWWGLE